MTFYELFAIDQVKADDIDDYVEVWHNNDSPEPVYKYLGMTESEYGKWVETGTVPPPPVGVYLKCRKPIHYEYPCDCRRHDK